MGGGGERVEVLTGKEEIERLEREVEVLRVKFEAGEEGGKFNYMKMKSVLRKRMELRGQLEEYRGGRGGGNKCIGGVGRK